MTRRNAENKVAPVWVTPKGGLFSEPPRRCSGQAPAARPSIRGIPAGGRTRGARLSRRSLLADQRGFALIELTVVVLILGILVAIGIPTYDASKFKSEDAACKHNLRTIDGAIVAYRSSNPSDKLPITWAKLVPDYVRDIPNCATGTYTLGADDRLHCSDADPGPPLRHAY